MRVQIKQQQQQQKLMILKSTIFLLDHHFDRYIIQSRAKNLNIPYEVIEDCNLQQVESKRICVVRPTINIQKNFIAISKKKKHSDHGATPFRPRLRTDYEPHKIFNIMDTANELQQVNINLPFLHQVLANLNNMRMNRNRECIFGRAPIVSFVIRDHICSFAMFRIHFNFYFLKFASSLLFLECLLLANRVW